MIINYEDTMREISKRLDGKGCDIVESKDSAYFLFVTHDKDFASLCNLMASTQGTVDIPFKCKSIINSGRGYSITNWEVFAVEKMSELHTNDDVYVIRIYGSEYKNDNMPYEDGVVLPISSFEDGELVKLESEGYSVEVVSYNPIKVRLFSSKKCKECNHCYYVFRHLCKLKPNNNNTVNPNDTSCSFFEEKKKCEDCEGYCPPKHPDSLGACRKHEFRSCSGNRERCYDFVDKHTYFLCKHYRGDGDGEYEFCVKENVTGRRCSMQSTCPHFEKAYVPSNKDWTKCAALVRSMGDDTYFCGRCGGFGAYCKKENCSSVMEKIS